MIDRIDGNLKMAKPFRILRMGKITSDLEVFGLLGDSVTVTIELAEKQDIKEGEDMGALEQELLEAYQKRCDAMMAKDVDALAQMMSLYCAT